MNLCQTPPPPVIKICEWGPWGQTTLIMLGDAQVTHIEQTGLKVSDNQQQFLFLHFFYAIVPYK